MVEKQARFNTLSIKGREFYAEEALEMIISSMVSAPLEPNLIEGVGWVLGRVDRVRLVREALERAIDSTPFLLAGMEIIHPSSNVTMRVLEVFERAGLQMLKAEQKVDGISTYEILPVDECAAFQIFMLLYSGAEARLN